MRRSLGEFVDELGRDTARRILFVEGIRDLIFWRNVIPTLERGNTMIQSIAELDAPGHQGGERGRMLAIAEALSETDIASRVRFFADANGDRILGRAAPANVILTDSRDLETYAACPLCLDGIASDAFGQLLMAPEFLVTTARVLRPIAALRALSDRDGLGLPFSRTFSRGLARFLEGAGADMELGVRRLCEVLLQNAGRSLSERDGLVAGIGAELARLQGMADDELMHGKDFVRMLAVHFNAPIEEIERHVFVALGRNAQSLAERPNLAAASAWVRRP